MFETVPDWFFTEAVNEAMESSTLVNDMLSHDVDLTDFACYLTPDGLSGYAVSASGELISVFNVSGESRGKELVTSAIDNGAWRLDCFDGYLPKFYGQFGFKEVRREPNWTEGGPDVVWMELS
jgi:hypothetical protein